MKRLILILLGLTYLTSVSGVTVNRHYCGGKLASISLSIASSGHDCPCGKKEMKKSCCKDHNIQIKVKCEHKAAAKITVTKKMSSINTFFTTLFFFAGNFTTGTIISYDTPPPKPNNALLVLNSIFRI